MLQLAWTDLLPQLPHPKMGSIHQKDQQVLITLVSTRETDLCPTCHTCSQAGHGWFTRCIHSLPCSGQAVTFLVHARRFRCLNPACPRKTFREDLSALALRYQRRTPAVTHFLSSAGLDRRWPSWCLFSKTDPVSHESLHPSSLPPSPSRVLI